MFDIEYKGGNAVIVSGKKTLLAVDPSVTALGLKNTKLTDAVELITEDRFKVVDPSLRLLIEGPGEYEVGDFAIRGVPAVRLIDDEKAEKVGTLYRVERGDVSIGILGNIEARLSEDQLEALGIVDILVVPVGGGGTLDATNASTLVRMIEPKIVIPVHYADPALQYEVPQDTVETFIGELGAPVEEVVKLKIKSSASIPAVMTVYKISRS